MRADAAEGYGISFPLERKPVDAAGAAVPDVGAGNFLCPKRRVTRILK